LASDIFWRHDSGQVYLWEMNGMNVKMEGTIAHDAVPNIWQVQGIGDFDGDGKSDILWRNDSGQIYIREMNGLNAKGPARARILRSPAIATSRASARNAAVSTAAYSVGASTRRTRRGDRA